MDQEMVAQSERKVLEEQESEGVKGALRAEASLGEGVGLPVRKIGAVSPPLLPGVKELLFAQEHRGPLPSDR